MILGYFVLIPCLIYRFYSHDFRIDCTNIFLNRLLQLDRRVSVNLVGLKGSLRDSEDIGLRAGRRFVSAVVPPMRGLSSLDTRRDGFEQD